MWSVAGGSCEEAPAAVSVGSTFLNDDQTYEKIKGCGAHVVERAVQLYGLTTFLTLHGGRVVSWLGSSSVDGLGLAFM